MNGDAWETWALLTCALLLATVIVALVFDAIRALREEREENIRERTRNLVGGCWFQQGERK